MNSKRQPTNISIIQTKDLYIFERMFIIQKCHIFKLKFDLKIEEPSTNKNDRKREWKQNTTDRGIS